MGAKRGRIPAVPSNHIDDELLNNKNLIRDDLSLNPKQTVVVPLGLI